MQKETGPASAAAEGVNVPLPEQAMPNVAEINAAQESEAVAKEKQETAESPVSHVERVSQEVSGRAQEKLLAQNTGLLNRITNVVKRGWDVVKGFGRFVGFGKEDDNDPRNAERKLAAQEKAQQKAELAEGKAFMKSEEARLKQESLEAAVEKAKEAHRIKLEREAMARETRMIIGRGAAALLAKTEGKDPEKMNLSEAEALAIGTLIQGLKTGARGLINAPERMRTGLRSAKDSVVQSAEDLNNTVGDLIMYDDIGETLVGAGRGMASMLSFTAATLLNRPVKDEILGMLGEKKEVVERTYENGKLVKEREEELGTRTAIMRALKSQTALSMKAMGGALAETWAEIRDSEAAAAAKRGVKNTAKVTAAGAGGYAAGTTAVVATPYMMGAAATGAAIAAPLALMGASYIMGAAATGAAAYGAYRGVKKGYEVGAAAVNAKLTKMAPAIADVVAPALMLAANLADAPGDAMRAYPKLCEDIHDVLMTTAEDINANTRKAAAAYNTLTSRLNTISTAFGTLFNKLEAEAISEAKRKEFPVLSENVAAAAELRAQIDDAAKNAA